MEDKKKQMKAAGKPGKPAKEVIAGIRKLPTMLNLGGKNAAGKGKV